MIRRLRIDWPDPAPFDNRADRPIRWLVVSDAEDPALRHGVNRDNLGPIDAILGAGDLEPDYLGFLADAFGAPLVFVRGNHDHGGRWEASVALASPEPTATGAVRAISGLDVATLEWPGLRYGDRMRHDSSAWLDVARIARRRLVARVAGGPKPLIVLSHAPPRGVGDRAADAYHVGFSAYRFLLDWSRPRLWLHGHVPPASVEGWRLDHGGSTVVNVTGAVLVEVVQVGA